MSVVGQLVAWAATRYATNPTPDESQLPADRLALLRQREARTRHTDLRTKLLQDDYLLRADVEAQNLRKILTCKAGMLRLHRDCIARADFLDPAQKTKMASIIEDATRALLFEFAGRGNEGVVTSEETSGVTE